MKAVVLAGGVRSGLEIPGSGLPRALWPFPDAPLITRVLRFLKNQGCSEIAICANGKTRMIASELSTGNSPWLNIHYSEDPFPRGPAGCLRDLHPWLGDESFVVIQGTADYAFDLSLMARQHAETGAMVTVGARTCEHDAALLEPAGVYMIRPEALAYIPTQGYQDLKEQFLPKVLASGQSVRCHRLVGRVTLIHSPSHYLNAIDHAIVERSQNLPAGFVQTDSGAIVHETARVHPSARLKGNVWIDAGAVVEEHAVVAGPAIVGAKAHVGSHALVHRSVLMAGSRVSTAAESISAVVPPHATIKAVPAYEITVSQKAIAASARARSKMPLGPIKTFLTRIGQTVLAR